MSVKLKSRVARPETTEIPISTEFIKLDSFLKLAHAVGTGGMAAKLLAAKIATDGEVCFQRGKKLRPGDTAELDGHIYKVTAE